MQKHLYHLLIFIVIVFKLGFLLSTFAFKYFKMYDILDKETMETMEKIRDQFLTVSEVFMYIVLIIVFSPHRKSVDIKLSREEQIIAFAIGILGLLHTNWNTFKKLFYLGRGEIKDVYNYVVNI
tara:strand:+ start:6975 stop:7346 length:372 start_codon:yes stop_codon:yes gene_type:complete